MNTRTHNKHHQNVALSATSNERAHTETELHDQNKKATKAMGDLLLKGWKMLDKSCAPCSFPIMQSKKGALLCCNCNKDYSKPEESKSKPQPKEEAKPQPKEVAPKTVTQNPVEDEIPPFKGGAVMYDIPRGNTLQ